MAMIAISSTSSSSSSPDGPVDVNRCVKMALVHDLAEATVGDITPYCGVSDADKHRRESDAMKKLTDLLNLGQRPTSVCGLTADDDSEGTIGDVGAEILGLWEEYEAGSTAEAKLIKDMDKLEMILQAQEYEHDGKNIRSLDGFFDGTRNKWLTCVGRAWGREIESRRPLQQAPETRTGRNEK